MPPLKLRFFIDRGGTFTDVIARTSNGRLIVSKILSQSLNGQKEAAIEAIEAIVKAEQAKLADAYNGIEIESIRLGTTVATNALLERKGEPTALITNKGFGDALIIGYQNRADIFALNIKRPSPIFSDVIELDCRYGESGEELTGFDQNDALKKLAASRSQGLKSAAIVFMHGYKYKQHEIDCGKLAAQTGFENIYLSGQSSGLIRYISRGDTTLIDAYLTPPLQRYIDSVNAALPKNTPLFFMKSDGGLADRAGFSGKNAILSGPAGGVVGAVAVAQNHSKETVIGFDMGGTSTDVSYYQRRFEKQMECTIGGVRLRAPMVAVHTVAAGGGSILSFDGSRFLVGPESAGAVPGPACYGRGGPATVTDANLILGRLAAADFPRLFGADGKQPLDIEASKRRLEEIAALVKTCDLYKNSNSYNSIEKIAFGFLTIANEKMAQAIAKVSIQKGHDIRNATLVAFGGAGGQHACMLAQHLGIESILLSPLAGVLSAYGIGKTNLSESRQSTVRATLAADKLISLKEKFALLIDDAKAALPNQNQNQNQKEQPYRISKQLGLVYKGSDTTLFIEAGEDTDLAAVELLFKQEHQRLFGFVFDENEIIIESILVEVTAMQSGNQTRTRGKNIIFRKEYQQCQNKIDLGVYSARKSGSRPV